MLTRLVEILLIEALQHPQLSIREMAHWHLVRMVPKGKEIPYDAAGTPESLKQAHDKWKELVPEGTVPGKK